MLSNFKKIFLDPLVYRSPPEQEQESFLSRTESQADASDIDYPGQMNDDVAQQHWAIAMAETVYVAGCTCAFCNRHSETDDDADPGRTPTRSRSRSYVRSSLPSTRSIMQVLYPPSYLGTPSPFPDPPSYSPSDSPPYPARGDDAEISPLISSTTISINPLAQDPSLTGVPSQGTPSSRVPPVEPNPPVTASRGDALEETEPLPAYSRFDQRRPRYPVASDILGPYPPSSVLYQAARRRTYTPD